MWLQLMKRFNNSVQTYKSKAMKLITKNLKGVLKTGERFRVVFEDKYDRAWRDRSVFVLFQIYDEDFAIWSLKECVCKKYSDVRGYKQALRDALIDAEEKWNIQLLQAEMKIAI